ncbi:hypothetical protein HIM_06898 [Hirsutella minnesotensis 3608]|uniref:Core domain-containing protein n=1 Tax=Hirsutella minnesotensis 3608 TaxID=1043627 RepID=A0A0F7ZNH9_9HYPO|nr:hypothetical protein HIM_06898 [Hirsutella minnesotensis 3608]
MVSFRCANSASAARSFIQIANRGYSVSATRTPVALEFLVPRSYRNPASRRAPSYRANCKLPASLSRPFQRRTFSASISRNATKVTLNPRQDEDGNEMMLEITPRAAKVSSIAERFRDTRLTGRIFQRLTEIMKKDDNPNLALRIQVESGGCHGFQYLMSLVTIPAEGGQEWSSIVNEDDTILQYFSDEPDNSTAYSQNPRIILDEASLDLLKGSKVDYTMELIGSQFKIVDNPYATSSCGCGSSFDIKG